VDAHAEKCRRLSEHAFELARDLLDADQAKEISEFIYKYNEWGMGLETLVDVLLEDNIAVSSDQKKAIMVAMREMGLDRNQTLLIVSG